MNWFQYDRDLRHAKSLQIDFIFSNFVVYIGWKTWKLENQLFSWTPSCDYTYHIYALPPIILREESPKIWQSLVPSEYD